MRCFTYFLLNIKRCLKRPAILLLLALFPLLALLFFQFGKDRRETLTVMLYTPAQEGLPVVLIDKLTCREGVITFLRADSKEDLTRKVASGDAECGYLIPADLSDRLDAGENNNLFDVVISQDTTLTGITNEIIFAEFFEEYAPNILLDALSDTVSSSAASKDQIIAEYRRHLEEGFGFSFIYEGKYSSYSGIRKGIGMQVFKGLTAILILIGGFLGILSHADCRESRIFSGIAKNRQHYLLLADTVVPVVLTTFTGALTLGIIGALPTPFALLRLLGYSLLVTLLCMAVFLILRRKTWILFLIPFYLLGCMVFTPILIDITMFVPKLRPLCMFFLPYYFC